MDFAWSDSDLAFARELEEFLEAELPPFIDQWADAEDLGASHGVTGAMEKRRAWQHTLNKGRWAAILWPALSFVPGCGIMPAHHQTERENYAPY